MKWKDAKSREQKERLICAALFKFGGNRTAAIEAIGIGTGRGYFYKVLKEAGGEEGLLRKVCGVRRDGVTGPGGVTAPAGSGGVTLKPWYLLTYADRARSFGIDMEAAAALVAKLDPQRPPRKSRKATLKFEKDDELLLKEVGIEIERRSDRAPRVSDVLALVMGHVRRLGSPREIADRLLEQDPGEGE